jgi:RNA-directed DNA polymerase
VLEPIFEADLEDNTYGCRPARGAVVAVKQVHQHICQGYTDVVDADLSGYFDSIPHDALLKSVACRVADGQVLRLIKLWLKAPIEARDGDGKQGVAQWAQATAPLLYSAEARIRRRQTDVRKCPGFEHHASRH